MPRKKQTPRKGSQLKNGEQQQQQRRRRQQQEEEKKKKKEARAVAESARLTALGSSLHPSRIVPPSTLARGQQQAVSTQTIVQKLDVIIQKLNQLVVAETRKPNYRRGGKRTTIKSRKKKRKRKTKRRR